MLEAYEYDYGTAFLCDDHYIYAETFCTNLSRIANLVMDCPHCLIKYKEDD